MAELVWGTAGDRFFETGVDRGVLYPKTGDGVAWSGLVSVSEAPSGGEARPYYLDGFKYLNLATAEEFEATIDAYSAPVEFDRCDGTASIHNGLYITQQPRESFGFSYRTKVGNDVDGTDHGYKIHVVYNALAAPSSRNNATLTDSPEPITFSWGVTTSPAPVSGFKPTAHFVIDSRKTPPFVMRAIEEVLYGSELTNPVLPSPEEMSDIFSTEPLWVEIRRNRAINPAFRVDTTGWTDFDGDGSLAGTSDTVTSGGPADDDFLRWTVTTGDTAAVTIAATVDNDPEDLDPGTIISLSCWVRASKEVTVELNGESMTRGGSYVDGVTGPELMMEANVWSQIIVENVLLEDGADTIRGLITFQSREWEVDDTIDITWYLSEESLEVLPYFDGTMPPSTSNPPNVFSRVRWVDDPDDSPSVLEIQDWN